MKTLASSLGSFLHLAARPMVMVFFLFSLLICWVVPSALSEPKLFPALFADLVVVHAFVFPTLMGLIGAQLIQELQHSTFAWTLPGVARRTLAGFLATGVMIALVMVALLARSGHSPWVVFAVAWTGYSLGSLFADPRGGVVGVATIPSAVLVLVFSRVLGDLGESRPGAFLAGALAVCGLCLWRTFARSTFRRKLFLPTKTMATDFSPAAAERYARERLLEHGPTRRVWDASYLGRDLGRWTRASAYESHGAPKNLKETLVGIVPLVLIFPAHAWVEAGDGGFWEAFGKTLYHSLVRPPDMPSFSEEGEPHFLAACIISLVGIMTALQGPVALRLSHLYPLSRSDRGRLAYRNHLATVGSYLLIVGPVCLGLWLLTGYLVGYELRLGFVPLWLLAILSTLVVLPLFQLRFLRAQRAAEKQKTETGAGWVLLAILLGFAIAVGSIALPSLLPSPVAQLVVLATLVALSQTICRRDLLRFYATADLA